MEGDIFSLTVKSHLAFGRGLSAGNEGGHHTASDAGFGGAGHPPVIAAQCHTRGLVRGVMSHLALCPVKHSMMTVRRAEVHCAGRVERKLKCQSSPMFRLCDNVGKIEQITEERSMLSGICTLLLC